MASLVALTLLAGQAVAFPWVAGTPGVDSTLLKRGVELEARQAGRADTCPFNANHKNAVPISAKYPYCGAKGGKPGKQACPNNPVPAPGDTAHQWVAPGPNDIRGPCPGINTAANHNFLAHDGITTFNELVDMQQNVYGVGYDLAVLLATLGVGLDGDPITQKLSIGCDATSRTSFNKRGAEPGLVGHNRFEADSSLTRNDFFTNGGDNFSFNQTLFDHMSDSTKGNFGRAEMSYFRQQRYNESRAENGNFYHGPKSLLLYGASSFLYELFPNLGDQGAPDQATQESFFIQQKIPDNWFSRVTPYDIRAVGGEIRDQYFLNPVAFGGNTGNPNSFVGIGSQGVNFQNSMFTGTPQGVICLMYQFATENNPAFLQGQIPTANLLFAVAKLNPIFRNFGCPLRLNPA